MEPWLRRLTDRAIEGMEAPGPFPEVSASASKLEGAFAQCAEITAAHSRTFYFASRRLPVERRQAIHAQYAFCRLTDNITDLGRANASKELANWRRRAMSLSPPGDDAIPLAWAATRARYRIPAAYAEGLIDGVRRDLEQSRYSSFEELADYCFGVAGTVGLMSMTIIGFSGSEAVPYAIKLGVALQLTNILRDVGEDWRRGRVYLPQDELARFGLSDSDIAKGRVGERWREFMRFQIGRNRRLYEEAMPGIALLNREGRFAVAAAADIYAQILGDIERHDYDVFNRRAYVSRWGKLWRLPAIWLQVRSAPDPSGISP